MSPRKHFFPGLLTTPRDRNGDAAQPSILFEEAKIVEGRIASKESAIAAGCGETRPEIIGPIRPEFLPISGFRVRKPQYRGVQCLTRRNPLYRRRSRPLQSGYPTSSTATVVQIAST